MEFDAIASTYCYFNISPSAKLKLEHTIYHWKIRSLHCFRAEVTWKTILQSKVEEFKQDKHLELVCGYDSN